MEKSHQMELEVLSRSAPNSNVTTCGKGERQHIGKRFDLGPEFQPRTARVVACNQQAFMSSFPVKRKLFQIYSHSRTSQSINIYMKSISWSGKGVHTESFDATPEAGDTVLQLFRVVFCHQRTELNEGHKYVTLQTCRTIQSKVSIK